jgi:hypothetical protein
VSLHRHGVQLVEGGVVQPPRAFSELFVVDLIDNLDDHAVLPAMLPVRVAIDAADVKLIDGYVTTAYGE